MKKYAFFLPQFHEIPENNEWWGNGFTEWVNVKRAKALFSNHLQPKRPLNQNYYNLLDKDTVKWQTELMKTYKVDGMIYYHYYFTGKKLLEKPENYYNREMSWLQFNYRILNEAKDKSIPLFERLNFLSITESNLSEFFMVRVAYLIDLVHSDV